MILLPSASAHTPPWQIQLFAFINVAPNPAGLGQTVTLGFWLNAPPMTAGGPYGDRFGPFTVHVVKPDGTNETLGPFTSDDTGGTSTRYTPTQLGEYKFQMTFPGETLTGTTNNPGGDHPSQNAGYVNDTILPATSEVATLTVQQEPVPAIANPALPTSYWQTPINAMNVNNWYAIGGPYLSLYTSYGPGKGGSNYNTTTNFNPYTTAPLSSHIMWTRPAAFGGVIGGDAGGTTTYGNYYSTSQYERKYSPIVINGVLYYTEFPGSSTTPVANIAVDLYTGKTLWVDDSSNFGGGTAAQPMLTTSGIVTPFACGQVLDYVSPNQYGGIAYLWTQGTPTWLDGKVQPFTTTLNMFDAMTGKYILSIVNGTGFGYGNTVDASGDLISYYTNTTVGTQTIYGQIQPNIGPAPTTVTNTPGNSLLEVWNSTQAIMMGSGWAGPSASGWMWRPRQGAVIPFSYGIQSAWQLPGTVPIGAYANNATLPTPWAIMGINSGVAVLYSAANNGLTFYFQSGYEIFTGYDINTGNQLWVQNESFTPFTAVNLDNYGNVGDGVFTTVIKETGQVTAFSVTTGKQVWTRTLTGENGAPINPYDTIGGIKGNIYGDNFILFGFGGDIWSLKMSDGTVNWYTNTTILTGDAGANTPYGVWPIWVQTGMGGGGGVVFLEEGHEYSPPLFLGSQLLALNTTTGQLVWTIDSFDVNSNPELAYGIMTTLNAYDNQIYAYGQGPSAITVNAPEIGVTTATPITITGTVTDVSAGAKQEAVAANYPNGLPAVSDDSMTSFMESVYMQQPIPHNVTGVPVTLSVVDANGNYRTIGTTTSDGTGAYGYTWTPDISGSYTVIATFAGSGAYYGSTAQAHFYASESAAPTTAPTPIAANYTTTTDFMLGVAAIIVVIIIIGALIMLSLKKRP
ncbi:MAG: PQQ-binding-like beta-propeller repeat protein [Chloroflexi bacterium]|nr:PQQ-binding-like beta-propeller repeat protein [Chloroflexota bacterium]